MKKIVLLALLSSLLSACTTNSVEDPKSLDHLETQSEWIKAAETPAVDPSDFFAPGIFEQEGDGVWGYFYNVIYPYDVPDLDAWLDTIDGYEEIDAKLQKDYSKFDPLLLLENDPEALAKNFSYEGKEALTLNEIQHLQDLKQTLETVLTQEERWEPGPEAVVLIPPKSYPGWYPNPESEETEPIQSLLYVDWETWKKTTEETWKSYDESWDWEDPEGSIVTFFNRGESSSFAYAPNENGFFLAGTSSYSYFSGDGQGSGAHHTLYSYDAGGRLQESFSIVQGEGILYDTTLFGFTSYIYDERGRLTGERSSGVSLGANQLSMPQLIYEQARYRAQAPLNP